MVHSYLTHAQALPSESRHTRPKSAASPENRIGDDVHLSRAKADSALSLFGHHGRCLVSELFSGIRTEVDEALPHVKQADKLRNLDQRQELRRLVAF